MKRSEVKAGEAYYYDRSNMWREYTSGGKKAVVVDDERYAINSNLWRGSREPQYMKDPKGTAVLVDIHWDDGQPAREAVPTAHLRGPWEEAKAEVDALRAARRAEEEAKSEARAAARDEVEAVQRRAAAIGFMFDTDGSRLRVTAAQMSTLLDAYEQLHPKGE